MISKFIVISDAGVYVFNNLVRLNKKLKTNFRMEDFTLFGSDRVVYLSKEDVTFQRDLHYLSQIPIANLFKVDKKPLIFTMLNFIFILICLMQIAGTRSYVAQIITLLGG